MSRECWHRRRRSDFFEVHAENYMVAGGPFLRHLERVRERWPLSIHGVGLSIGGEGPLDRATWRGWRRCCAASSRMVLRAPGLVQPRRPWFNDLLPLPYDAATLNRVCDHIDQVQQRLRRRLLLENPSTYVEFAASTMDEAQFLAEVVRAHRLRPAAGREQRLRQRASTTAATRWA